MSKDCASGGRNRHNISIPAEVRERGERLADEDKRSFSNFVAVLIDKEWERRLAHKDAIKRQPELPIEKEAA